MEHSSVQQYTGPMPDVDPEVDEDYQWCERQRVIALAQGITRNWEIYATVLHSSNLRRVIECINGGADPHFGSELPLHVTASKGHLAFLKFLHKVHGANLDSVDGYALRWSSFYGHRDVVDYLIDNGEKVGIEGAIRMARRQNHNDIALALEEVKQRENL